MEKPQNIVEATAFINDLISQEKSNILRCKSAALQYLTYSEFVTMCDKVMERWCRSMNLECPPKEIEAACCYAKAVIAPDMRTRVKILKKACGLASGLAGITAILSAVGMALGWGASITTVIINFFVGASVVPVIGWSIFGVGLLAIAAYFTFKSEDPFEISEKAEQVLRKGLLSAIEQSWKHTN